MNKEAANKIQLSNALDVEEYKEMSHQIVVRNDTSGISYLEYSQISINELRDDSICITLPKNICQKGHGLTLAIYSSTPKKVQKFPTSEAREVTSIIGKVIDLSPNGEDKVLIEIKFTQYKANEWSKIAQAYIKQQENISSLIDEVKK